MCQAQLLRQEKYISSEMKIRDHPSFQNNKPTQHAYSMADDSPLSYPEFTRLWKFSLACEVRMNVKLSLYKRMSIVVHQFVLLSCKKTNQQSSGNITQYQRMINFSLQQSPQHNFYTMHYSYQLSPDSLESLGLKRTLCYFSKFLAHHNTQSQFSIWFCSKATIENSDWLTVEHPQCSKATIEKSDWLIL